MKASASWNHTHYIPLHETARAAAPYICRIAPSATGFTCDFIDQCAPNAAYRLLWRRRDGEESHSMLLDSFSGSVEGLEPDTDYVFRIERDDGISSTERLVRTGAVPGTVVAYLHPDDPEYAFSGRHCSRCHGGS